MIQPLLKDTRVLICRPEPAASELAEVLRSVGAEAQCLPCIEIVENSLSAPQRQLIMNLDGFDHVIVVSQHAARFALEHIDQYWPQFPSGQTWHAIGRQTARALPIEELNISLPNADLSSEMLLNESSLRNVRGKKVLLLKGEKGRSTLREKLEHRGAQVSELELYKRIKPAYDQAQLNRVLIEFNPDYFVALSGETLENLLSFFKQSGFDGQNKRFILSSNRVSDIANQQGFHLTYVPNNLMPIDMIRCLAQAQKEKR